MEESNANQCCEQSLALLLLQTRESDDFPGSRGEAITLCLLQTWMLEDLVTNKWLLLGVAVELSEGETSLKVVVGGGS